nr:hypothetical protein RNT25_00220 [arsenite-oxidising bacterium NT-25]CAD6617450.1 hypothetical protein RKHAN_03387 [Rhizobium sp. Khangiran2]
MVPLRGVTNNRSPFWSGVHKSFRCQPSDRFTHRRATDAQDLAEIMLRREKAARLYITANNGQPELIMHAHARVKIGNQGFPGTGIAG